MCLLPFLCPFSSHTEIAYSEWLLFFHRVKRETDLPVRLLEKFTYSSNEFFVYHIDTQVITQRKCIQNRRFSKHISYVAAWTSFNLQETSARTTVTQKKKIKWPNTVYSLFKTRWVSREMQHDRVTSEHINITLEKSKSKWSWLWRWRLHLRKRLR